MRAILRLLGETNLVKVFSESSKQLCGPSSLLAMICCFATTYQPLSNCWIKITLLLGPGFSGGFLVILVSIMSGWWNQFSVVTDM